MDQCGESKLEQLVKTYITEDNEKFSKTKTRNKTKLKDLQGNKINEWYYIARVTSSIFLAKEQFKVFF